LATSVIADENPPTLLYLSETAPVFIRLHVSINGASHEEPWRDLVDLLFENYDTNSNGVLDDSEAARVNPSQLAQWGVRPTGQTRVAGIGLGGKATKPELDKYVRNIAGNPFVISILTAPQTQVRDPFGRTNAAAPPVNLLAKLDGDGDGKLAIEELGLTPAMRKLDLDDDETISALELQPFISPYQVRTRPNTRQQPKTTSPFMRLDSKLAETRLVVVLLERYDKKQNGSGDNRLSLEELRIGEAMFDEYDRDDDGHLDVDELGPFVRAEPTTVDVDVSIHDGDARRTAVKLRQSEADLAFPVAVRNGTAGQASLVFDRVQIEFAALAGNRSQTQAIVGAYTRFLDQYDADKNEYLDTNEVSRSPIRNLFSVIDSDNNGQVFRNELSAYATRVSAAQLARTMLTVASKGNQLFEVLDANQDRRITQLELVAGRQRIADWDRDGDGKVAAAEVPQYWSLTISRGAQPTQATPTALVRRSAAMFGTVNRRPGSGPVWFQTMDRNQDGTVSRREFLGELEDFGDLDQNDDGVLSLSETSQAN
jgi:hypothetical protein